jgi:hypothetical protein
MLALRKEWIIYPSPDGGLPIVALRYPTFENFL